MTRTFLTSFAQNSLITKIFIPSFIPARKNSIFSSGKPLSSFPRLFCSRPLELFFWDGSKLLKVTFRNNNSESEPQTLHFSKFCRNILTSKRHLLSKFSYLNGNGTMILTPWHQMKWFQPERTDQSLWRLSFTLASKPVRLHHWRLW